MIKKFILVAAMAVSGSTVFAQHYKAPNEGAKFNLTASVSSINPALFQKAPTTLWENNADESWYNATAAEFTLTTPAQVAGLAKIVNAGNDFAGKTIIFGSDLDFAAHLWTPIGKGYQTPFSGTIKGEGKTVSNIFINIPEGDFVGFVGQMYSGRMENLNADAFTISAADTAGSLVGNLSTNSTMDNCHAKNVVIEITGYNAGGMVGGILTDSHVTNSSAEASVTGTNQIGGFVGTVWDKTSITNSYAKGTVSAQYIVGGFVGFSTMAFGPDRNNVITDSYTTADVYAAQERAGGFYGGAQFNAITSNVYSAGTVTGSNMIGGYAGFVGSTVVENAYYDVTKAPYEAVGMVEGPPMDFPIVGKATAEMQSQELVDLLNAGRTEAVWFHDPARNNGYPILDFEATLSSTEVNAAQKIKVYPTLVTDFVYVDSKDKNLTFTVVDFSGRVMKSGKVTDGKVNLSSLQKGNYILVLNGAAQKSSQKIIKK